MSSAGLVAVLWMVLEWSHPGLPYPLRPICDLRVLDLFIKEARDTEVAMRGCREGCGMAGPLTVPLTNVDFVIWEKKNSQEQAREVQIGLWLLGRAISTVRDSVTNVEVRSLLDNSYSNIHSVGQVIRTLNLQDTSTITTSGADGSDTWQISSPSELFRVHINFLRGKVHLVLSHAPACQQESS